MDYPAGVRASGKGLQIRVTFNGRTYTKTIHGDATKKSNIAIAVKARQRLKNRLELGLPLHEDDSRKNDFFANIAQEYLNTLDADLSTHLSYECIFNKYWMPAFGNWMISDIRTSHIKRVLSKYKHLSNKTKKNLLGPLRGALRYAIEEELIDYNPALNIRLKKHQKPNIERFTPKEREEILNSLKGQEQVYFSLFFGTGMRPGEMIALRWQDYDGEFVTVSKSIVRRRFKGTTKNHESREVYIEPWLAAILNKHTTRNSNNYIFVNSKGGPYLDTDVFNRAWNRALRNAGILPRIPYTCRHTRASELLTKGIEPAFAAKQLGHTLEVFYRTYAKWIDAMGTNKELEKLGRSHTK